MGIISNSTTRSQSVSLDNIHIENFVERFYTNVLERGSDEAGLQNWSSKLENSTQTADDIANGFFHSTEFINKNTTNSEFVDITYRTLLGREADSGGKSNWINALENGSTRDSILDGFIYSNEFNTLAQNYGIDVSSPQKYFNDNYYSSENYNNLIKEVIDTQNELEDLYDKSEEVLEKSDYETTIAYTQKIEQFISEKGTITFKVNLDDSYNADTQRLTVYDVNLLDDTFVHDYGFLTDLSFEINNFRDFHFTYGYVDTDTDYWKEFNSIFHEFSVTASNAEALNNGFYMLVETNLTEDVPFAEHNWNRWTGTSDYVNVDADRILVVNGVDDTVYADYVL